jgi:hypothetical protein
MPRDRLAVTMVQEVRPMKRLWHAGLLLLLVAPLLVATAVAASSPPPRTRHTTALIESFAMSGSTVVYDTEGAPSPRCNLVMAWNVVTGKVTRVSGEKTCLADATSTGGVSRVAVAGKRFAWIADDGGISETTDHLRTATLPRPKERQLASAHRGGDIAGGGIAVGNWIGNLIGSGDILALNRWTTNESGVVTKSELDVIGAGGLRRVASGLNTFGAQAVDSGRIAVLRSDGAVAIYGAAGRLLLRITPSPAKEIALRGDRLLVLSKAKTLELYDSRSGEYLRSWPVPEGAGSLDSYGGVAIYANSPRYWGNYTVHALRLASGKDVVLASGAMGIRGFRSAFLEASGVVYEPTGRTLVFIPFKRVAAAVSR